MPSVVIQMDTASFKTTVESIPTVQAKKSVCPGYGVQTVTLVKTRDVSRNVGDKE